MHATLIRLETGDQGTFGAFRLNDLKLFSGELPKRNNVNDISCIPAGKYRCRVTFSNAFRRMLYLVEDVPGRAGVRIHSANFMGDTAKNLRCQLKGCIALGMNVGWIEKQKALISSCAAITLFENEAGREPFDLEIIDELA